jgi:hypothetical protein
MRHLSADSADGPTVYASASFAQVSLDPPRVAVSLNRTYALEAAVGKERRFAINVVPVGQSRVVHRAPRLLPRLLSRARPYRLRDWLLRPSLQRVRVRLPDRDGTGYVAEVREFLATVAEERPPASHPVDARRVLEIVLRSYEALERGERVPVPSYIPSQED